MHRFNPDKKTAMPWAAVDAMSKLIQLNEIKHPGQEWRNETMDYHFLHCMNHMIEYMLKKNTIDSESGMSVIVHAATRLAMAVEVEIEEQKKLKIEIL